MSLRSALIRGVFAVVCASIIIACILGVLSIRNNVSRQARERVDCHLNTAREIYDEELLSISRHIEEAAKILTLPAASWNKTIDRARSELGLTILNICDRNGKALAGSYNDFEIRVPIGSDPVLRNALDGKFTYGTVRLGPERLELEGGPHLAKSMTLPIKRKDDEGGKARMEAGLFWWAAYPVITRNGHIKAIVYGGKSLNLEFDLVRRLQRLAFGAGANKTESSGVVTILLDNVRIAMNIAGKDGLHEIGTVIPEDIAAKVLENSEIRDHRTLVDGSLYLGAFHHLRNPDGKAVGMLYIGMPEGPYTELKQTAIKEFLLILGLISIAVMGVILLVVDRMTKPLVRLSDIASKMTKDQWNQEVPEYEKYPEFAQLSKLYKKVQRAVTERNKQLDDKTLELADARAKQENVHTNYEGMRGFLTRVLKTSLSVMENMVSSVLDNYVGQLSEEIKQTLLRVQRNCEELQDMLKNCINLSRIERGDLEASKKKFDFRTEVVDTCVTQTTHLFNSRNITLEVVCPDSLMVFADPELTQIALTNYLSNAAKYGSEESQAKLEVSEDNEMVVVSVLNKGEGFTEEDGEKLFKKFSYINNTTTHNKHGSCLGLFLTKQIVDLHYGKVTASSVPGDSTRFAFTLPNPKITVLDE